MNVLLVQSLADNVHKGQFIHVPSVLTGTTSTTIGVFSNALMAISPAPSHQLAAHAVKIVQNVTLTLNAWNVRKEKP